MDSESERAERLKNFLNDEFIGVVYCNNSKKVFAIYYLPEEHYFDDPDMLKGEDHTDLRLIRTTRTKLSEILNTTLSKGSEPEYSNLVIEYFENLISKEIIEI